MNRTEFINELYENVAFVFAHEKEFIEDFGSLANTEETRKGVSYTISNFHMSGSNCVLRFYSDAEPNYVYTEFINTNLVLDWIETIRNDS